MADQLTPGQFDQIVDALADGRKIAAVKIYRQATGKGLKESKDFVEALIPKLKEQNPEKYAGLSESSSGQVSVLCAATLPLDARTRAWFEGDDTMADKLSNEQIEQITAALGGGRKIDAIKIYREATGKGLKEANDFIDALIPKLKERDPEKYSHLGTRGAGCGSAILLGIGLASVLVWIVESIA